MELYFPEWKLYLWKKLLLNNDGFGKRVVSLKDFIFFDEMEQRKIIIAKNQKITSSSQNAHNIALATRKPLESYHGKYQPTDDEYYSCTPMKALVSLIELADEKPHAISIKASLNKLYITHYRDEKRRFDVKQATLRMISIDRNPTSYNASKNWMGDPFCGLGESIYKKAENNQLLTLDDLKKMIRIMRDSAREHLMFEVKINKSALQKRLDKYLSDFETSNLIPSEGVRYFDPNLQRQDIYSAVQAMTSKFGTKNLQVTPHGIAQYAGWTGGKEKHYRIFETLLSLEKTGEIAVIDLRKDEVIISLNTIVRAPAPHTATESSYDTKEDTDKITVQTKHGELELNKATGDFQLNEVIGTLNPTSQEYGILLKLMTSKNYQAPYSFLITGPTTKTSKRTLSFVIRNLKESLGILPIKDSKNKDIIKNVPNIGYRLSV